MTALKYKTESRRYTYQDYLGWDDDKRYEIINGIVYDMSPAPGVWHQNATLAIGSFFLQKLKGKKCQVFIAPTDVLLSDDNVVQPDIFIVCDSKKITNRCIDGAPDVVFEVLSPSTSLKDKRTKKDLYEKFGVKEYVLVNTTENYVEHYRLKNNVYSSGLVLGPKDTLALDTLHIKIPLAEFLGQENGMNNILPFKTKKRS